MIDHQRVKASALPTPTFVMLDIEHLELADQATEHDGAYSWHYSDAIRIPSAPAYHVPNFMAHLPLPHYQVDRLTTAHQALNEIRSPQRLPIKSLWRQIAQGLARLRGLICRSAGERECLLAPDIGKRARHVALIGGLHRLACPSGHCGPQRLPDAPR